MSIPSCIHIVIVNYNAGSRLRDCVVSALQSDCEVRVWVSDNGSDDDSLALLRQAAPNEARLNIVENHANLGFAKGNNRILPLLPESEFILFLNPDCLLRPDTISRMCSAMNEHPQAGMASCLIVNPDGSEQRGCRRTLPTPWQSLVQVLQLQRLFPASSLFRSFNLTDTPLPDKPTPVEATSGAFMLVRSSALERVGPLDEGYFLHCEDIDWCARFASQGYQLLFVPDVRITHYQGSCSKRHPFRVEWHKHRGMLRFYRKFYAQRYPLPLMWAVYSMVILRLTVLACLFLGRRIVPGMRRDQREDVSSAS